MVDENLFKTYRQVLTAEPCNVSGICRNLQYIGYLEGFVMYQVLLGV